MKGAEVEGLAASFPSLVGHLSSEQREDLETKMAALRGQWGRLRALLDSRLELSERYVRFHSLAVRLATQVSTLIFISLSINLKQYAQKT